MGLAPKGHRTNRNVERLFSPACAGNLRNARPECKDARLRILTFTSLFPHSLDPTYGIFIYQRSRHLAARPGNEVTAVAPLPYFPTWLKSKKWRIPREIPSEEHFGELLVKHPRYLLIPKISMPVHALSMFLGSLPCVRALYRQNRFDCIDAHFVYPDGLAAVLLGKALGVPVVVSARGTDLNVFPEHGTIRPLIRWTIQQADALVAVSAALGELLEQLGAPRGKIHVIPNAVETERFRRISMLEARKLLQLPEGPLLVAVGALIPSKGHQLLIEALPELLHEWPQLQLHILGEGGYRAELERLITKLGLKKSVQLPGKRPNEELPLWFNAATASCLASLREGWPNVVSESLACGAPVVATGVGAIPQIISSPELGLIVDQNTEAIAQGLRYALAKQWNREAIAQQSSRRNWKDVAEEVESVLRASVRQRRTKEPEWHKTERQKE